MDRSAADMLSKVCIEIFPPDREKTRRMQRHVRVVESYVRHRAWMTMAAGSATNAWHHDALARWPDGYVDGNFGGRSWGETVKRSEDGKRIWLYGEELSGTDIVSFNLYRLAGPGSILKPCEMSAAKVIDFVRGFEPNTKKATSLR